MNIQRRSFIRKSSLAVIGLGIANSLLSRVVSSVSGFTETILEKLTRAAKLRKSAIPDLDKAYNIYQDVINTDSLEIRAYNGKRKILLQSKYKELEILNMFITLSNDNPSKILFKTRVAKEYMRLALGHKKFANEISNQHDLLETAKQIFYDAKILDSDKYTKEYEAQYKKAETRLYQDVTIDPRNNSTLRNQKKTNRTDYQNRFEIYTSVEVQSSLSKLLLKPYSKDRLHHIKDTYRILINKQIFEEKIPEAIESVKKLYSVDKKDPNSLYIARKILNKYEYYSDIVIIEEENHEIKKNFWSGLALFDTKLRLYDKKSVGTTLELDKLYIEINLIDPGFSILFEIKTRGVKIDLVKDDLPSAYTSLIALSKSIKGITSAHWIDRFNSLCFQYFKKINDPYKAIMVINIALKENSHPLNDQLLQMIDVVNKRRVTDKPIHNYRLMSLRNQLAN